MFAPLEACYLRIIITSPLSVLAGAVQLRRWDSINPLSPNDALKHHFTCLKKDLIFLQLGVLERKYP